MRLVVMIGIITYCDVHGYKITSIDLYAWAFVIFMAMDICDFIRRKP